MLVVPGVKVAKFALVTVPDILSAPAPPERSMTFSATFVLEPKVRLPRFNVPVVIKSEATRVPSPVVDPPIVVVPPTVAVPSFSFQNDVFEFAFGELNVALPEIARSAADWINEALFTVAAEITKLPATVHDVVWVTVEDVVIVRLLNAVPASPWSSLAVLGFKVTVLDPAVKPLNVTGTAGALLLFVQLPETFMFAPSVRSAPRSIVTFEKLYAPFTVAAPMISKVDEPAVIVPPELSVPVN